jgi:cathepsin L
MNLFTYCFFISAVGLNQCYHTNYQENYDLIHEFHNWTVQYNKTQYWNSEQNLTRIINNYADNKKYIEEHNSWNPTFTLELNQFADVHYEDWLYHKHFNEHMFVKDFNAPIEKTEVDGLPPSVDWRDQRLVTPVKNQQQCGSCWTFSATGSMEGQHAKKTGDLISLSESQIVDCDVNGTDQGCDGGLMDGAFQYVINNGGIEREDDYPYKPVDGPCKFKKNKVAARFKGYHDVTGGEAGLKEAVATIGPISVGIDASNPSFQFYKSGVYYEPECSSTMLDHGVLVIGYGTENGTNFWLVKNSWGESWGMDGYIKMSRDKNNNCGIATQPSYPTNFL